MGIFHWTLQLLISSSACPETVALTASFHVCFLDAAISFLHLLHLVSLNSTSIKGERKILTGTSNCALQYRAKAEVPPSCANVESAQITGSLFHGLHIPRTTSREMHLNSWKPLTKTPIRPLAEFIPSCWLVSINCGAGPKRFWWKTGSIC